MVLQPPDSDSDLHRETNTLPLLDSESSGPESASGGKALWNDDAAMSMGPVVLQVAQITQLFRQATSGIYGALISCTVVTLLLWNIVSKTQLIFWSLSVTVLYLGRHSMVLVFRRSARAEQSVLSWGRWFCILSAVSGLTWGMGTVALFPHASVVHQSLMVIVIGGLCSGASIVYCPVKMAYIPFILLAGIPIASRFLYEGSSIHILVGCVMLMYIAIIIETANRMHDTVTEILKLRSEKNRFIDHLLAAGKELQGSEARYRQMFERNRAIKLLIDPESGGIVDSNPAASQFYGYGSDHLRRLKILDIDTSPPDQIFREMAETRSEQKTYFLSQHRLASGEVRDVEVYSGPMDVQGRQLLYSIIHDITERRKAEEALKESEETYRRIFSNIEDVYFEILLDGTVVQVSPSVQRILGYSREEALGIPVQGVYAFPEDRPVLLQKLREDGAIQDYEVAIVCKDGTVRQCQINARLIYDRTGIPLRICGILRDVTERKRSEEALMESEERFRQLAENVDDIFMLIRPADPYSLIYVSPAYERVTHCKVDDLYKDPIGWLDLVSEDFRDTITQMFNAFIGGYEDFNCEFQIVRPSGDARWIWATGFEIKDSEGKPYRFGMTARDITKRKSDEERLGHLVEEIKDFAYIISHDCRAPLINVKGFAGELESGIEAIWPAVRMGLPSLNEKQKSQTLAALEGDIPEALSFIHSSVSRMDGLLNAILNLSRLERRELHVESLNMNQLVEETLKSLSYQLEATKAKVHVSELPPIAADRLAMEQVMTNLLSNALKFRDPERPQEIHVTGHRFPDETVFVVRDQGLGVDPAYLTQIFQSFNRGSIREAPGEGMGLAHVRTLIRRHGGRIWCESNPGSGSTFTFTVANQLPPKRST